MVRTKKSITKRGRPDPDVESSSDPQELNADMFRDEATFQRFLANPNHQVLTGWSMDSFHLGSPSFRNLYNYFYTQNEWTFFLKYNNMYEPAMIRQFFANFRIKSSTCIESIVYGNLISFSPNDLCKHFSVASDLGVKITSGSFDKYIPNYSHLTALRSLLDPTCTNLSSTSVADLTVENRMLHHIVTHTITPRSGSYSAATPFDVGLMFMIRNGVNINLPYLMFYHICHCASIPKTAYPYGMHLTSFLVNFMKIPSIPANVVTPDPRHSKYSHSSISMLFRHDDATETWHRKFKVSSTTPQVPPVNLSAAAPSFAPSSDIPSNSSGPSHGDDRLDQILSRMDTFNNRFDSLENRFNSFDTRFNSFDTRFDSIDARLANLELARNQQEEFPTDFFDLN